MNTLELIEKKAEQLGCRCLREEPMAKNTTFKIGGPADLLVYAGSFSQLRGILTACRENQVPVQLLGNGSNILVSDKGFRGVVVQLAGDFNRITREGDAGICCGAGASLASACIYARDHDLTGLEFAWGIPGSIGGAVYMNAGAYGGELKDRLVWVEYLNEDGQVQRLFTEQLGLSYRHSCFMEQPFLHGCILRAAFALEQGDRTAIEQEMERIITQRREKQPLEYPSAGSTFKRPAGHYAGTLIDQCGLKGLTVGGAQVSEKHAGFVINRGGATCADVVELIRQIQARVLDAAGVRLEPEVKIID